MKVFISWSGETSHKVALALRDWLPSVIQSVVPYVSSEDIDKGTRWSTDISKELEDSTCGILCVTNENIDAPWINFEAGALSKSIDRSRVSPFLFGLKRSDVHGPILQFQSTIFEKEDVSKLIHSLNNAEEKPHIDEGRLSTIFDVWWPKLEDELNRIGPDQKKTDVRKPKDKDDPSAEILEEILELSRRQHRILNSPEDLLPKSYLDFVMSRPGRRPIDHPVFRDLEIRMREVRAKLELYDEGDLISKEEIIELFSTIDGPIDYIINRFADSETRFRRTLAKVSN